MAMEGCEMALDESERPKVLAGSRLRLFREGGCRVPAFTGEFAGAAKYWVLDGGCPGTGRTKQEALFPLKLSTPLLLDNFMKQSIKRENKKRNVVSGRAW